MNKRTVSVLLVVCCSALTFVMVNILSADQPATLPAETTEKKTPPQPEIGPEITKECQVECSPLNGRDACASPIMMCVVNIEETKRCGFDVTDCVVNCRVEYDKNTPGRKIRDTSTDTCGEGYYCVLDKQLGNFCKASGDTRGASATSELATMECSPGTKSWMTRTWKDGQVSTRLICVPSGPINWATIIPQSF